MVTKIVIIIVAFLTFSAILNNQVCRRFQTCLSLKHAVYRNLRTSTCDRSDTTLRYIWGLWSKQRVPKIFRTVVSQNHNFVRARRTVIHNKFDVWDAVKKIDQEVPGFLNVYSRVPRNVCKADLGRYALMYLYGGMYLDLDVEITDCSVLEVPRSKELVCFYERDGFFPAQKNQVANYAFVANPHSKVLKAVIQRSVELCSAHIHSKWSDEDVLAFTGPTMFSNQIFQHSTLAIIRDFGVLHSRAGTWRSGADM